MKISSRQLRFIASMSRRMPMRGTARILRRLHGPSSRAEAIDAVISIGDGLVLNTSTRSDIEWVLFFRGAERFEPGIRDVLRKHISPGQFVVDVGANVGVHTLAMAKFASPGRVAAFEPSPHVRRRLESNIALNALTNIDVHPVALGDKDGIAKLIVPANEPEMSAYASLRPNARYLVQSDSVDVRVARLDAFADLPSASKVSLIKIDVEGFEPEVLDGAAGILAKDRPVLLFEYDKEWWGESSHSLAEVVSKLSGSGYDHFFEITGRGKREIGPAQIAAKYMNVLAYSSHGGHSKESG